jgi:hypothetical protein
MKVKIFTFVFNRPDILQYQIDCFNKYLEDKFEINVVYDTRDNQFLADFTEICKKNNINLYHHLSQPGNTPSFYHSDSVQWIYDTVISKDPEDCFVLIVDHDIFLIESFSVNNFMKENDLSGCIQTRGSVQYVWQGLFIFRKSALQKEEFNFYPQIVGGQVLDSCGGTYKLIRSPNIRFLPTDVQYPEEYNGINLRDPMASNGGFEIELHLNEKFLHYRNASCWHNNMKVNDSPKTKILYNILDNFIKTNG